MTYFWVIRVFDDGTEAESDARVIIKGTGSLQHLTAAVAAVALEMELDQVLDINIDPIPERVTA